ncbi:hypothetical protein HNR46_003984 [Haloferula luteola]|uniref:Uncharacterized protein n=1 Tax=Haloferula luteola TaxID=595692 RepID=A0A840V7M7_9BACT|nr:beta-1,6-N-acetylglucosaminyltransferase [Haloferula luteola]MBB5353723.1 hypothetical protein [Haloferula luteola]
MSLERIPAPPGDKALTAPAIVRGYDDAGRYALALTQRLAIRRAKLRRAEAVLLLEDDVIFHPNFRALAEGIDLPDDWGMFFLGCKHVEEPIPCAPGVVRVTHAIDTHAVAIRQPYFNRVIGALDAHGKPTPDHPLASDRFLAALQKEIPSYACFPNLAWQATDSSDLLHQTYSSYHLAGTQKAGLDLIERTYARMAGIPLAMPGTCSPKLGLLFLTRGDVHHPDIWREFVGEHPDKVRVFSHPKTPDATQGGFLEGTIIPEYHKTEWGSVSLVKASLALLRTALEDERLTHFVLLSESCIPIRPLSEMLRHLRRKPRSRFGWKDLEKCSDLQRGRAAHLPQIPDGCWKFQSQWWLLERLAAEWVARADYTDVFGGMPIPDEAYFATVLSLLGYPVDDRVVNHDITWADWSRSAGSPESFRSVDWLTVETMAESGAWFARKFPPDSDIAKWGLHRTEI